MLKRIDTRKLVKHFGGRTPCQVLLTQAGYDISKKTIEKWQERESIPMSRVLQLIDADRRINKRTLDINDFLTK
jgi:hypothetical protein